LLPALAEGPPLVGCLWLLIQYIPSCPPYLEAASSIHNLMLHAMVMIMNMLQNVSQVAEFQVWMLSRNVMLMLFSTCSESLSHKHSTELGVDEI
jgi:hypothetical protein